MPSYDLFHQPADPIEQNEAPDTGVRIHPTWKRTLGEEFRKPYFQAIRKFLLEEQTRGNRIYPPGKLIFNAFDQTPLDKLKVVILGQDPYHGVGQAHGLCFSVPHGIRPPPSLVNIFKEIAEDLDVPVPGSGNLLPWALQGVLLLNAVLTVQASKPASHQHIGWQTFTDKIIEIISLKLEGIVFLLWGNYALQKSALIDAGKHLVLKAPHPSPYSAGKGFFGCRHFSKTNEFLAGRGLEPIDWGTTGQP